MVLQLLDTDSSSGERPGWLDVINRAFAQSVHELVFLPRI